MLVPFFHSLNKTNEFTYDPTYRTLHIPHNTAFEIMAANLFGRCLKEERRKSTVWFSPALLLGDHTANLAHFSLSRYDYIICSPFCTFPS